MDGLSSDGKSRRDEWREIIFEAETPAGKRFDVVLLWLIGLSVLVVMLDSVPEISSRHSRLLRQLEWGFTIAFSIEYAVRLFVVRRPLRYARSFFGVVDLLSVLPSYLTLFLPGAQALQVIRILRMMRMFRVFKMVRHVSGADLLLRAVLESRAKITVFFSFMVAVSVIAGTLMYLIEGAGGGYTSIPAGIYWAVVTITTLGFGDITPATGVGRTLTALLALTGYAVIAVPTGILTAEIARQSGDATSDSCPGCGVHGHLPDAKFCRRCGARMD